MIVKSLSIKNYCAFSKEQTLKFAIPNGKEEIKQCIKKRTGLFCRKGKVKEDQEQELKTTFDKFYEFFN